ncbi:MAG: YgaP-like transmembrane domain [Gordonia sp. (in: high G+C Gram-positive bacteria)]|uniref:YgaP-like transmembrane domain n=1 Tax=Gordonia TaxID=2053 RepID=UPI0032667545
MSKTSRPMTVERAVPLMAAIVIAISIALVVAFGPWWLILTGFVAANLAFYSAAGWCPASFVMGKLGLPHTACAVPGR